MTIISYWKSRLPLLKKKIYVRPSPTGFSFFILFYWSPCLRSAFGCSIGACARCTRYWTGWTVICRANSTDLFPTTPVFRNSAGWTKQQPKPSNARNNYSNSRSNLSAMHRTNFKHHLPFATTVSNGCSTIRNWRRNKWKNCSRPSIHWTTSSGWINPCCFSPGSTTDNSPTAVRSKSTASSNGC